MDLREAADRVTNLVYLYWPGFLNAMVLAGLAFLATGSRLIGEIVFIAVMAAHFYWYIIKGEKPYDLGD